MAWHIRYTPVNGVFIDDITTFAQHYESALVAYEDKDKMGNPVKPHYHMLIQSECQKPALVERLRRILKIPAGGRGVNNKHYACMANWRRPEYIAKWGDIVYHKGWLEEDIAKAIEEGRNKYLFQPQPQPATVEEVPTEPREVIKHTEYEKLICYFNAMESKPATILGYKQKIAFKYLMEMRPIPRVGDLERYAFSLFAWFNAAKMDNEDKLRGIIADYLNNVE